MGMHTCTTDLSGVRTVHVVGRCLSLVGVELLPLLSHEEEHSGGHQKEQPPQTDAVRPVNVPAKNHFSVLLGLDVFRKLHRVDDGSQQFTKS